MEKLSQLRPINHNGLKTNRVKTQLYVLDQYLSEQDLATIAAVEQTRGTSSALSRDKIMNSLRSSANQWYGTYHHDKLVGYCVLDALDRHEATLKNIGVCPDHQGQGFGADVLGKAVTSYLESYRQRDKYLDRVKLYVLPNNQRAIKLFQKFGFKDDDFCHFMMTVRQNEFMERARKFLEPELTR